ncbi:DUF7848 domain-containing protein [Streptomyces sp. NPDC054933]
MSAPEPWTIHRDPTALPIYEAECVTGETADCCAASGSKHSIGEVGEWMETHLKETGHTRYLRIFSDCAIMQRESAPLEPAKRPHLTAVKDD